MKYIRVLWHHTDSDDPIELYSEIDDQSWEARKVEVFRDGRVGFASREAMSASTRLGLVPVPPLHEIASNPEFSPEEISKSEFERMWQSACAVVKAR